MKTFDKPLGVEIEEQIPVTKLKVFDDNGTPKVSRVTEMEKQTVVYFDPTPRKVTCKDGEHYWIVEDKSKYLFSCTKCPRKRTVFPISYEYVDGKLINKRTGRAV
jgi:hypothetical protein